MTVHIGMSYRYVCITRYREMCVCVCDGDGDVPCMTDAEVRRVICAHE